MHARVYRLAGSERSRHQSVMAACLAGGPGTIASHASAALVWALPGVPGAGGCPEVTIAEGRRLRIDGVVVHRASRVDRVDVVWHRGIPTTSVARTLIDLAADLDRRRLEALLDHVLAERLIPLGYLQSRLEALGTQGRAGAGVLAELVALRLDGCGRPATGFERLLQAALGRAGLPRAEREHVVRLPGGRSIRVDFAFVEHRLGVEADSYRYHSTLSDWSRDRTRSNELVALGWRILPVTYRDLQEDPGAVMDRIRRALAAGEVRSIGRA
jgi:very-short-patch-repair endonuclease